MREFYKPGDYLVICDRSGEKAFRSECVKEWNGLIVKREYAESRHPLDLQQPPRKEWIPRDTRPINDVEVAYGEVDYTYYPPVGLPFYLANGSSRTLAKDALLYVLFYLENGTLSQLLISPSKTIDFYRANGTNQTLRLL